MNEQQKREMTELKSHIHEIIEFSVKKNIMDVSNLNSEKIENVIRQVVNERKNEPFHLIDASYDKDSKKIKVTVKSKLRNKITLEIVFDNVIL